MTCLPVVWLGIGLAWSTSVGGAGQSADDECRELDRIVYTDIMESWRSLGIDDGEERLRISTIDTDSSALSHLAGWDRHGSPRETAFFVEVAPDTSQPGPWDTALFVYGNQARPLGVRVDLLGHATYGVNTKWLNEKLLFIEVWLGRIVAAELILDVENSHLLSAEIADHGRTIHPCAEKRQLP